MFDLWPDDVNALAISALALMYFIPLSIYSFIRSFVHSFCTADLSPYRSGT